MPMGIRVRVSSDKLRRGVLFNQALGRHGKVASSTNSRRRPFIVDNPLSRLHHVEFHDHLLGVFNRFPSASERVGDTTERLINFLFGCAIIAVCCSNFELFFPLWSPVRVDDFVK